MSNFHSRWIDWTPESRDTSESQREPFVSIVSGVSKHSESAIASLQTKPSPESLRYGTDNTDKSPFTPFAQLESDWAAAWGRAQEGFAVHGTSPTHETLQAVTVLELWIADGGSPRRGMNFEDLKGWTRAIYRGRGSARVSADGRVVLRALGDFEQEKSK